MYISHNNTFLCMCRVTWKWRLCVGFVRTVRKPSNDCGCTCINCNKYCSLLSDRLWSRVCRIIIMPRARVYYIIIEVILADLIIIIIIILTFIILITKVL